MFAPTARFRAFAPKIGKFRAFAQQHSGGDVGVCAGVCGCLRVSCVVGGSRTVVRGAGRGDASGARSGGVSKNVLLKKSMIWPAASEQSAARGRRGQRWSRDFGLGRPPWNKQVYHTDFCRLPNLRNNKDAGMPVRPLQSQFCFDGLRPVG